MAGNPTAARATSLARVTRPSADVTARDPAVTLPRLSPGISELEKLGRCVWSSRHTNTRSTDSSATGC
ncbi:hypothetical protein ACFPM0_10455 [Pseudonocardia sulfidoxydans]|uniref:hypothetical protein n=1 Tax=Pseudonocardia sulfidoxydans TaxID=54011 RepID=UPI00361719BC